MAQTKSAPTVYNGASSLATHSFNFSLSAGTSRKITMIVLGDPGGAPTINSATFDGNAMTERVARVHASDSAVKGKVYTYDVSDGTGTGSKTVEFVLSSAHADVSAYVWQTTDSAAGAPEYANYTEASNAVTPVSNTGVTCSGDAVILAAAITGSATPTFTWSGSATETAESNETNYTTGCGDSSGNTAGTKTVTATASTSAGYKLLFVVSIAASGATLTDVDTDETITTGQASVAYTGTLLTDADGLVVITGTKEAAATAFSATNATSGTFTAPSLSAVRTAGVKFGTCTFQIEDGGVSLATLAGTINPESGWQAHNVSDISQAADTGCIYYGQSPAVAVGDQIIFVSNGSNVTIDTQGFVVMDGVTSFDYYVFDATDETWGTVGTFSTLSTDTTAPIKPAIRAAVQSAVQTAI